MEEKNNYEGETSSNLFMMASKEIDEENKLDSNVDADTNVSFGSLFDSVNNEDIDDLSDNLDNIKIEDNTSTSSFGDLLSQEEKSEDINTNNLETIDDKIDNDSLDVVINNDIDNFSKVEESNESINPFVQESNDNKNNDLEIDNKFDNSSSNIIVNNDIDNSSKVEESNESINPFVQESNDSKNNDLEIDNKIDNSSSDIIVNNDIDNFSKVEESNESINPFVQESNDNKNKNIEQTNFVNPFVSSSNNTNETIKDDNPFFAGKNIETVEKVNPFFENKISLNEKNVFSNNNQINFDDIPHYNVKVHKKKQSPFKFIIGVLSYALFICLLLLGITLLIYVGNNKLKSMRGDTTPPKYNAYVVLTGSMLPEIQVEDVVITKKVDAEELEKGDIITFASSDSRYYGTVITHRIINKYYDSTTDKFTFQSKGDNNNVADSALVEEDKIYGKVILKIPKLGYLQVFLASRGGWILVILLPCAVVISFDIVKLFKLGAKNRKLKVVK